MALDLKIGVYIYAGLLLLSIGIFLEAHAKQERRVSPILHILNSGTYEKMLYPNFEAEKPTVVTCDIFVNSLDSVSVEGMDLNVNIYLRQTWQDKRLDYRHLSNDSLITLDRSSVEKIWVPDLFFPNEKESHAHTVTVPNQAVRVYANGTVRYSSRFSLTLACPMPLHKYPFDKQTCHIRLESYGYTLDELQFVWLDVDPVQVNDGLALAQFEVGQWSIKECQSSYITGNFTCLDVSLPLYRQYSYFLFQTYVPTILIVTLSWVSFWINIDAIPARISLGVLTVLTMTTQSIGLWMTLPRVSYVKAVDIWMSVCVLFVFFAMLEFAIVNTMTRKEIRRITMKVKKSNPGGSHKEVISNAVDELNYGSSKITDSSRKLARTVDKVSRRLFPSIFAGFNLVYWLYYLLSE